MSSSIKRPLTIGGISALELAQTYQTPLYVYDVTAIRQQIRDLKQALGTTDVVSYASKAFATIAMYQLAAQEGTHVDVVSGGELATALAGDFPPEAISFHGNNKSLVELTEAVDAKVGTIIVDNFDELAQLQHLLHEKQTVQNILLRVAPGISAHTHRYIQTGQVDSKFGFDLTSRQADRAAQIALDDPFLNLLGIHAHIGSQIFAAEGFEAEVKTLLAVLNDWHDRFDFIPQVLNVGGGFGIAYTSEDQPRPPANLVGDIVTTVSQQMQAYPWTRPQIWIEPGRSIVGPAGYSLYTVGDRKDVTGLRPYVAVDGGMGDNIRPALYQATYQAVLANDPSAPIEEVVHLVGKYCESGDILVDEAPLPKTRPGDVIALLATGAYGYSMASNYNRNLIPAVVFVEDGHAQLVVKRQTYTDLLANDLSYRPATAKEAH